MHPASDNTAQAVPWWLARVRLAAAQTTTQLPLLPLGPGGVHQGCLARGPTVNTALQRQSLNDEAAGGELAPTIADCGYREPQAPRLARRKAPPWPDAPATQQRPGHMSWRREWDSNPRYPCGYTRSPGAHLRPLGHLSAHPLPGLASQEVGDGNMLAEREGFEPSSGV